MAYPVHCKTAWQDPMTRRAWRRTAVLRCAALPAWLLGFLAWLFAVVMTPAWLLVLWLPVLCVGIWYTLLAVIATTSLARTRRVLRVYPWQVGVAEAKPKENGSTRFVVSDPERPEKTVSLGHGGLIGTRGHFWVRAVKSGHVTETWFAGDPRYLGVVAAPGPRHLLWVAQREATDSRMPPRKKGVSPAARAMARAAGARVGTD
ncbi:hypothetical protein GKJPGBOP_03909 [Streptomyces paromomycinus]|uniref:Uncharacterized protein n=1 Tax=Streptomyces paromomycinus TaxID=92743 RepID=A0A401W4F9_STREY|nr:hypothetical protein GKJPGBOP_03909 [Streptomyces paromomycinus]